MSEPQSTRVYISTRGRLDQDVNWDCCDQGIFVDEDSVTTRVRAAISDEYSQHSYWFSEKDGSLVRIQLPISEVVANPPDWVRQIHSIHSVPGTMTIVPTALECHLNLENSYQAFYDTGCNSVVLYAANYRGDVPLAIRMNDHFSILIGSNRLVGCILTSVDKKTYHYGKWIPLENHEEAALYNRMVLWISSDRYDFDALNQLESEASQLRPTALKAVLLSVIDEQYYYKELSEQQAKLPPTGTLVAQWPVR